MTRVIFILSFLLLFACSSGALYTSNRVEPGNLSPYVIATLQENGQTIMPVYQWTLPLEYERKEILRNMFSSTSWKEYTELRLKYRLATVMIRRIEHTFGLY